MAVAARGGRRSASSGPWSYFLAHFSHGRGIAGLVAAGPGGRRVDGPLTVVVACRHTRCRQGAPGCRDGTAVDGLPPPRLQANPSGAFREHSSLCVGGSGKSARSASSVTRGLGVTRRHGSISGGSTWKWCVLRKSAVTADRVPPPPPGIADGLRRHLPNSLRLVMLAVVAVIAGAVLVGCSVPQPDAADCAGAPNQVIHEISTRLTTTGHLRNARVVRVRGADLYFVSAELVPKGQSSQYVGDILTWVTPNLSNGTFDSVGIKAEKDTSWPASSISVTAEGALNSLAVAHSWSSEHSPSRSVNRPPPPPVCPRCASIFPADDNVRPLIAFGRNRSLQEFGCSIRHHNLYRDRCFLRDYSPYLAVPARCHATRDRAGCLDVDGGVRFGSYL